MKENVEEPSPNMYRVGDYVYFENSGSGLYAVRRIEELNKIPNGNFLFIAARLLHNLLFCTSITLWGKCDFLRYYS